MKISLDWLSQYVDIDTPPSQLADMLTMTGFEVEAVMDPYEHLSGVVVGKITGIRPHPSADRLSCCAVDTGVRTVSIVCGAPNLKNGMNAACAVPGTVLPSGTKIESGRIRGELSEGMLCSEAELGLGTDFSRVMVVDPGIAPGTSLAEAAGAADTVFEIGLTPNRPDCLSFIGIAREVAALLGASLKLPEIHIVPGAANIHETTSVAIKNPELCPRYAARVLSGVTVGPSPAWLQRRLLSIGLKPINNLVDITNFVLMETGQPLHAFDFHMLSGNRIEVRTCISENEKAFTTLDGKQRRIEEDTLMICDGAAPVAIAGVMGGENSEIKDNTTDVLIESACFDPVSIRKTAKRLGLSTEASYRFERGVDPEGTVFALNRAAALMAEASGGVIAEGIIDEYPGKKRTDPIRLSTNKTNRHLGTALDAEDIARHLRLVEFDVSVRDGDAMEVLRPPFRVDVSRPEDLMEEVARLSGYNNIPTTFPEISPGSGPPHRSHELADDIRELMTGFGFNETIHYSFTSENGQRLKLPEKDARRNELPLVNPISETQCVLRTTLVASLLEACQKNLFRQERDLKLFELGKAFYSNGAHRLPDETGLLAAVWTGVRNPRSWHDKPAPCDFFDIKGSLESFFSALGVTGTKYTQTPAEHCGYTQPGRSATVFAEAIELGVIGEIKPEVLQEFDIHQPVFAFEITTDPLVHLVPGDPVFTPIPRFPPITRDLTLIVEDRVEAGEIIRAIEGLNVDIIEDISVFDVYSGRPIEKGKKSLSIRITYRSREQTLEDGPVNRLHREITEKLLDAFSADLP